MNPAELSKKVSEAAANGELATEEGQNKFLQGIGVNVDSDVEEKANLTNLMNSAANASAALDKLQSAVGGASAAAETNTTATQANATT